MHDIKNYFTAIGSGDVRLFVFHCRLNCWFVHSYKVYRSLCRVQRMEHGKTENVFNTKQIPDRTEQNKKTKKLLSKQTLSNDI
ncbi:hypothetical protein T4A_1483 [Trichinella pseudospiralis]|uniref:Uncharacterized protein n=1 Tax=Trichinella pseudospiralis TaxID=6337 RepID=A0A0V1EH35_TRIPS|nr:hypothetical protein T4A_1483 [Trichinella pseudospiralis]